MAPPKTPTGYLTTGQATDRLLGAQRQLGVVDAGNPGMASHSLEADTSVRPATEGLSFIPRDAAVQEIRFALVQGEVSAVLLTCDGRKVPIPVSTWQTDYGLDGLRTGQFRSQVPGGVGSLDGQALINEINFTEWLSIKLPDKFSKEFVFASVQAQFQQAIHQGSVRDMTPGHSNPPTASTPELMFIDDVIAGIVAVFECPLGPAVARFLKAAISGDIRAWKRHGTGPIPINPMAWEGAEVDMHEFQKRGGVGLRLLGQTYHLYRVLIAKDDFDYLLRPGGSAAPTETAVVKPRDTIQSGAITQPEPAEGSPSLDSSDSYLEPRPAGTASIRAAVEQVYTKATDDPPNINDIVRPVKDILLIQRLSASKRQIQTVAGEARFKKLRHPVGKYKQRNVNR